jgi:hypothetical protein
MPLMLTCVQQGQTYETIIEDTIRGSQADFLEAGISLDYLEALRTVYLLPPVQSQISNLSIRYGNPN